jgi:DNA-directed RNA polymerase specialized sigma24 family protein
MSLPLQIFFLLYIHNPNPIPAINNSNIRIVNLNRTHPMMSRNFTPEQTLIDRLGLDDTEAFEELSRRYCYSLYAYCISKLNSKEDAKRIVRNIFIALWEDRYFLPLNFSLSLHLYTEVRKAVVQCVNVKLNNSRDLSAIEENILPGFNPVQLQKAKQAIKKTNNTLSNSLSSEVSKRRYEEQWWNKYAPSINLKDLKHAFKTMLNVW